MESTTSTPLRFEAPGPGSWRMDSAHFSKPVFGALEEVFPPAFADGMRAACEQHGMLLETFDVRFVHGFPYMQPRPLGAKPGSDPPRWLLRALFPILTRVHGEMRRRMATARTLFDVRPWHAAMTRWDTELRSATVARHAAIGAVDLASLDDAQLAAHLDRVLAHAIAILTQDHSLNLTVFLPVGDYIANVRSWTGATPAEILETLRGASAVSRGDSPERIALVAALRRDAGARALLEGTDPPLEKWERLAQWPGEVGDAFRAFRLLSGNAICHGIDLGTPTVDERPSAVLAALRISVARDGESANTSVSDRKTRELRERVPAEKRALFDSLLEEARLTYRLRDERHLYGALPVLGIARKGVLEAGRRLAARGVLPTADHAIVCRISELSRWLRGNDASSERASIDERMRLRDTLVASAVPETLGPAPAPPPDPEWLPNEGARRAMRALNTYFEALDPSHAARTEPSRRDELRGLGVSAGSYTGTARLCLTSADLERVEPGDVLVATSTTSAINIVLPVLGAIVTDRGGALSHAAIVCREFGIPGVVGTREGSKRIRDGQRIRVDGDRGEVTLLADA